MNPKCVLISPQFYLVFDEIFETVSDLLSGNVPENWSALVASSKEKNVEGFYDLTKTWFKG